MIKTDKQLARLLGKADTYIARLDTQPKKKQRSLAEKALDTVLRVYNDTRSKRLRFVISSTLTGYHIYTKKNAIKLMKRQVRGLKSKLNSLEKSNKKYVAINMGTNHLATYDFPNSVWNALDRIMIDVIFDSPVFSDPKINSYLRRKYDANA